jgi:hypothetical protein
VPFYGYRFYSPEMGRWINRDPMNDKTFALSVGSLGSEQNEKIYRERIDRVIAEFLRTVLGRTDNEIIASWAELDDEYFEIMAVLKELGFLERLHVNDPLGHDMLFIFNQPLHKIDLLGLQYWSCASNWWTGKCRASHEGQKCKKCRVGSCEREGTCTTVAVNKGKSICRCACPSH